MKRALFPLKQASRRSFQALAWAWIGAAVATGATCLVVARLAAALDARLILCACFAVPAILSLHSSGRGLASFLAIIVFGVFQLSSDTPQARLSFVLVGLVFAASVIYITLSTGERLSESRKANGMMRLRSVTSQTAVQQAGVCVVVVTRQSRYWISVNEAAWTAFGADMELRKGMDARVEMDNDAATMLMHSASRESWRRFIEAVFADSAAASLQPGQSLPAYELELFDSRSIATRYRFTATLGQMDEFVFVGYPLGTTGGDSEATQESWLRNVVRSIDFPSVAVQSDGSIIAANREFFQRAGIDVGDYLFDAQCITGASEEEFSTNVWLPTRAGLSTLSDVSMEQVGNAVGLRIVPPQGHYAEVVLLVFIHEGDAIPDRLFEHSRPASL